jgi:hypothetical protein
MFKRSQQNSVLATVQKQARHTAPKCAQYPDFKKIRRSIN